MSLFNVTKGTIVKTYSYWNDYAKHLLEIKPNLVYYDLGDRSLLNNKLDYLFSHLHKKGIRIDICIIVKIITIKLNLQEVKFRKSSLCTT